MLDIHVKYNINFGGQNSLIFRKQYNLHAMNFFTFAKNCKIITLRAVKLLFLWMVKRKFVEIAIFEIAGILIGMVRVSALPFTYSWAF
jgi:hypothetical protein